jgi:ferredoxin
VKVRVIAEKCQGHGRCYSLAPELFESDDYGNSVVIGTGEVPARLEESARLAELNCPERAVVIEA